MAADAPVRITEAYDFLTAKPLMAGLALSGSQTQICAPLAKTSDPLALFARSAQAGHWGRSVIEYLEGPQISDTRAWDYQRCTELGGDYVAYHDPKVSVSPPLLDESYFRGKCEKAFGISSPVQAEALNQKYYDRILASGSNTLFVNGTADPLFGLTIAPENDNDANPAIESISIPGEAHGADMAYVHAPPPVQAARDKEVQAILGWVKAAAE